MTSSLTVVFSGTSSILQAHFLPEIILDDDYSCALLGLIIITNGENDLKKIVDLGVLLIDCDIISESYINGERKHTIHQFATSASDVKGLTFVEIPKHLNYFPVKTKNFRSIQVSIVDQNGKQVDTNGANIICRINIKRDIKEKSNKTC